MYPIEIDLTKDALFTETSLVNLKDRYLFPSEASPQEAFARAASAFADDQAHAQRLYSYVSKHWFMPSTPVLANAGTSNMPISCFLGYVPDSLQGIADHYKEIMFLTAKGGGVAGYWGDLRTLGKTNGMIPFMKVMDSLMLACSQSKTRRGSYAAYLDITHPDIEEFIEIRDPSGDHNRRCLGLGFHHGINITDAFMEAVDTDSTYDLIDPHSKTVTKTLKARDVWKKIINMRTKTGEPYLMFTDTANRALPKHLRDKGLRIRQSNLCTEIFLPTGLDYNDEFRTAICCLSSLNAAKYDEWRDVAPQFIEDVIRMLDNALQHFIDNAPPEAARAVYSAKMTRDLGLGLMGFHTYLQEHGVPFESSEALNFTNEIFDVIKSNADKASMKLGEEKGYYPDAYDAEGKLVDPFRNAHRLAVAPNASTSILCGDISPSCEPIPANAVKKGTLSGSFSYRNPTLIALLETKGQNTGETWKSIIAHDGSVQQLQCLSDEEKLVFKTAFEIDQTWIIEHAALRQLYIDQGQSVNVFFDSTAPIKVKSDLHRLAHKKGLKSLYYQRGRAVRSNEKLTVVKAREVLTDDGECVWCQ